MSVPRFSIITCTWNSAAFLQESIDSLLSQDNGDFEYIFVDGGSTDGTIERIHRVPIPFKFVTGVRGGISRAMNEGIRLATGDVIAHLHSDDYYAHPGVLTEVAKAFEESGVRWLFGRTMFRLGNEVKPPAWTVPRYSRRRILKSNFIPHEATFVKRALFNEVGGFDTERKYAMDYDMWLRLSAVSTPLQLDRYLAVFRQPSGSLSTSNRLAGFEEDFKIRLAHTGGTPWTKAYHWAHYLVRKRRLLQQGHCPRPATAS